MGLVSWGISGLQDKCLYQRGHFSGPNNLFSNLSHTHPCFSVSNGHYHYAWLLQLQNLPMCHNVFLAPKPYSLSLLCALNSGTEHQKTSSAWGVPSWKDQWMSCLIVWQSSCKQGSLQGVPSAVLLLFVCFLLLLLFLPLCFLWVRFP